MKPSLKGLMVTAAVSGLLGGTAARLQATETAPTVTKTTAKISTVNTKLGKISYAKAAADDSAKHSCKGKNDCKGQGGCKAGDNGCKAKNSCKGKGGCATDGSKPPQAA